MPRNVDLIRFNALRNALYHTARRRTFELWNRIFNFAVVALGAAAMSDVLAQVGVSQMYVGALVAAVGAMQLVFDFGGAARTHQALQRDYYHVLADIEEAPECTEDECRKWEGKLVRIGADEPPVLRGLDAKAYNDAIDALEWAEHERLIIPLSHRIFGPFYSFEGHRYDKVSERSAARGTAVPAE